MILHSRKVSPEQFMTLNANVARSIKIDDFDALIVVAWIRKEQKEKEKEEAEEKKKKEKEEAEEKKKKEKEEAEEKKKKEKEEAEEKKKKEKEETEEKKKKEKEEAEEKKAMRLREREEARSMRERHKKSIYVLNPLTKSTEHVTLYDSADFLAYTSTLQITGFKRLLSSGALHQDLIRSEMFNTLEEGAIYGYGVIEGILSTAITTMQSTVRKNAEYNFSSELAALYGHPILYMGSDVLLIGPGQEGAALGDVDSLFRSPNNGTFYLLERKTTLGPDLSQLVQQLQATKTAFLQKLRDVDFRASIGLVDPLFDEAAINSIAIEQGVFFEAGSDRVADELRDSGYHVLSQNRTFRPRRA
jgi:hypothetical protein